MNRKKVMILVLVAVVILACAVAGVGLGSLWSQDPKPTENPSTTAGTTIPEKPEGSTDPQDFTDPQTPPDPTKPADPTVPSDPTDPAGPDDSVQEPPKPQKVEISVSREDGTLAQGAAVIATSSSGYQEYEPTDENGLAVLYLLEGEYSLRVFLDGQHADAQLKVGDQGVQRKICLKDDRKLYILLSVSGEYDCSPEELTAYSVLVDALKAKFPYAIFLTAENRYDTQYRDGDGLLTVEIFVENYSAKDRYFASEVSVNFTAYQECVTVWNTDTPGEELEIEFIDGNVCGIQVRNDYDYDYKDTVCVITESYYKVQKDRHLSKYIPRADVWGYGYTQVSVLSASSETQTKAPGAGGKAETFLSGDNAVRMGDYLTYVEQIFVYVDLWMSGRWNQEIDQLASAK